MNNFKSVFYEYNNDPLNRKEHCIITLNDENRTVYNKTTNCYYTLMDINYVKDHWRSINSLYGFKLKEYSLLSF